MRHTSVVVVAVLIYTFVFAWAPVRADDVAEFRDLVAPLAGNTTPEKPDERAQRAMELMFERAYMASATDVSSKHIDVVMKPYERVLKAMLPAGEIALATDYTWLAVHAARSGKLAAYSTELGAACRVVLYDRTTGTRLSLPDGYAWLYRWQATPRFLPDGTFVLDMCSVQDAGSRVGFRVDVLTPRGDEYRTVRSWKRAMALGTGGVTVRGGTIRLVSIEPPVWFETCAADPRFVRIEEYAVSGKRIRTLRDERRERELRIVDWWLANAYAARKPSAIQKLARKTAAGIRNLSDNDNSKVTTLPGNGVRVEIANVRFVLAKRGASFEVVSVETAR
jgi:hypothetical protein